MIIELEVDMYYEDVVSSIERNPKQSQDKNCVLCRNQSKNVNTLTKFVREGFDYFILKTYGLKKDCSDFGPTYKGELLHVQWKLEYRAKPYNIGRFEIVEVPDRKLEKKVKTKFNWIADNEI